MKGIGLEVIRLSSHRLHPLGSWSTYPKKELYLRRKILQFLPKIENKFKLYKNLLNFLKFQIVISSQVAFKKKKRKSWKVEFITCIHDKWSQAKPSAVQFPEDRTQLCQNIPPIVMIAQNCNIIIKRSKKMYHFLFYFILLFYYNIINITCIFFLKSYILNFKKKKRHNILNFIV